MKTKLIIICGSTATGKTNVSVEIAKKINGEIISCDSMQIYKKMDIGTAKVTKDEMQGIKHHLLDIKNPNEEFSVAIYKDMAMKAIKDIKSKNKQPILVGGTGLYMDSLIYNSNFSNALKDEKLREELRFLEEKNGKGYLKSVLMTIDPLRAEKLPDNDLTRIIRAIEIFKTTGITQTEHNLKNKELSSDIQPIIICLTYKNREKLYEKINNRVDKMIADGLVEEVNKLKNEFSDKTTAFYGIGYKEIISFLNGEYDLNTAINMIKQGSRRYAKRQITWFKRYENANFIYVDEVSNPIDSVLDIISQNMIC